MRFLLAATAASVIGDGMLVAATPLAAAALSPSPAGVGIVAAASTGAWLIFGIPAGVWVDRWDLRRTMILADLVRCLVLLALGLLLVADRASIASLSVGAFVVGIATCFFTPAGVALLRDLVGDDRTALTVANGRFRSIEALGRSLAGPPLGAWAFGIFRGLPFLADAVSFGASAVLLGFVPAPSRVSAPSSPWAGVTFLVRHRLMRILAMSAFAFNFGYFVVFAPFVVYATTRLHVGNLGFGVLVACGAAGSIVTGLLTRLFATRDVLSLYATVFLAQAGAWLVVWLVPSAVAAGAALAVVGAAATVGTVAGQAARQLGTPAGLLGRVAAAHRVASSGGGTVGALAGGFLAASLGFAAPFAVAVGFLGLCGVASWWAGLTSGTPDTSSVAG
jgi:MFS family permease